MRLKPVAGSLKGQYLWVRIGRDGDQGFILVLRRTLGSAVKRNRLKRRLRVVCREMDSPAVSLVVLALPPSINLPFHALQDELKALFPRLVGSSGQ